MSLRELYYISVINAANEILWTRAQTEAERKENFECRTTIAQDRANVSRGQKHLVRRVYFTTINHRVPGPNARYHRGDTNTSRPKRRTWLTFFSNRIDELAGDLCGIPKTYRRKSAEQIPSYNVPLPIRVARNEFKRNLSTSHAYTLYFDLSHSCCRYYKS